MKNEAALNENQYCAESESNDGTFFEHEDDLIAQQLASPEQEIRDLAFGRLHKKYYEIVSKYIEFKHPAVSPLGRDIIADATFDRIRERGTDSPFHTQDGSLGPLVNLICEWEARKVLRREVRRHNLLAKNLRESWCVQSDESQQYKCNTISERDVDELVSVMRKTLDPKLYPRAAKVWAAMAAVYIGTGGLQVEGLARNPSLSAIKNQLAIGGLQMSEEEISSTLQLLRKIAKRVMTENGWEIECLASNHA